MPTEGVAPASQFQFFFRAAGTCTRAPRVLKCPKRTLDVSEEQNGRHTALGQLGGHSGCCKQ